MSGSIDPDATIRLAAFDRLRQLTAIHGGPIPWATILEGFSHHGRHFHLASRAEGIFKPREMSAVLSLKTVVPRSTRKAWYDDQKGSDDRVRSPCDVLPYSFSGTDGEAARNRWLRSAML
jgi:putative restriction endonuclease